MLFLPLPGLENEPTSLAEACCRATLSQSKTGQIGYSAFNGRNLFSFPANAPNGQFKAIVRIEAVKRDGVDFPHHRSELTCCDGQDERTGQRPFRPVGKGSGDYSKRPYKITSLRQMAFSKEFRQRAAGSATN